MTLVVAADRREFAGLLARVGRGTPVASGLDFSRRIKVNGAEWLLVANGPGPALAGEAVRFGLAEGPVDRVVSTGFCGGLDPALPVAAVIAAEWVQDITGKQTFATRRLGRSGPSAAGAVISLDRVIHTRAERTELWRQGWAAVEMEAAAVGAAAKAQGLPFYCLRVVSDTAEAGFDLDLNRVRGRDGRFSLGKILWMAARQPGRVVPDLRRLQQQSARASAAIGEFLVSCEW